MLSGNDPDNARVVALAPRLYAGAFVVGLLLNAVRPLTFPRPTVTLVGGAMLLLGGGALAVWANRTLRSAGTAADPRRSTTTLVVTGPFGISRNPLYLARTLLYAGLALAMDAGWPLLTLLPLLALLHYGVIRREEIYLSSKFGAAYQAYRSTVPRWL